MKNWKRYLGATVEIENLTDDLQKKLLNSTFNLEAHKGCWSLLKDFLACTQC